jgi:patatin-like phospholipase/acyl hydrolase
MNPNKINILSIDGGGYRNIISVILLMELELRSKKNISAMFNMVGGTSFGSIIAACLNFPTLLNVKKPKYMTKDILNKWNRDVPNIFTNSNLI